MMNPPSRMQSVRTLVRYVDADQAVIDAHFRTFPFLADLHHPAPPTDRVVHIELEVDSLDGFHDEGEADVVLREHHGSVRFEVVSPQRWWPAGMGLQSLYSLKLRIVEEDMLDERQLTFGLTSVRRDRVLGEGYLPSLLVNGEICDIDSVVTVDRVDERNLLPATGESLLLVRDHFGADLLYEAADRAGILLIQCVPIDPRGWAEGAVAEQIDRLATHPSLAGYFVGHLGELSDRAAQAIRRLDPTRSVFRDFPVDDAA